MPTASWPSTGRKFAAFATCASVALTTYRAQTLSRAASRARISATPASAPASPANDPASGPSLPESLASYDPATCLWRTSQHSFIAELTVYSATWPRSGLMRNGIAYRLPPLVRLTDVTDSTLWPTPAAQEPGWKYIEVVDKNGNPPTHPHQRFYDKKTGRLVQKGLEQVVRMYPTPTVPNGGRSPKGGMSLTGMTPDGKKRQIDLAHFVRQSDGVSGQLNPTWVELLMGFPAGWTDISDEA